MARQLDYKAAADLLEAGLRNAEEAFALGKSLPTYHALEKLFDTIFSSNTQAYREVLLGCVLVRILDKDANLRLPYVSQGETAFHARDLDQEVVNPFLKQHEIPGSTGPYLNVFRRQVRFDAATREGLRDKAGYDALLFMLGYLEAQDDDLLLQQLLEYALLRFVLLREESVVPVARVHRISLRQYASLLDLLLSTRSGGLVPVLVVRAMLETIRDAFSLDWEIRCQGINVSDRSAGMEGDIAIERDGTLLIGIEVTERPVTEARVVSTFRTKIAPTGIEDYVFLVKLHLIGPDAIQQAEQYFALGHEVNFVDIREWVLNSLVTVGKSGRATFNKRLQDAMSEQGVPSQVRASWNSAIAAITTS